MTIKNIIQHESFGGVLLITAIFLALILNNSPLAWVTDAMLSTPVVIKVGGIGLDKPLLLWINDGLMAIFFFLIGLEVKQEILGGELSSVRKASLPILAAIGGIAAPALIYTYFNADTPTHMPGWAIPTATDIAFALGIFALLGDKVPKQLKIMLLSIAIIDDIAAIIIIAIFYTSKLSLLSLGLAIAGLAFAVLLNRLKVKEVTPYCLIGLVIWFCLVKSGVHATLAGAALALTIPMHGHKGKKSPLKTLEHDLHPWVYFGIMPLFAFANSGLNLSNFSFDMLTSTLSLGIILGLFVGKQIGVFSFIWIGNKMGLYKIPAKVTWLQIYGLSIITGIGFTMSLFIGTLAFENSAELNSQVRMAVLLASTLSAIIGYTVLKIGTRSKSGA